MPSRTSPTYSITELFRHWTKHALLNAIAQPDQFIEIGEALASKKGIAAGDTVKVMSKRGFIKAKGGGHQTSANADHRW
jgi:anaerobic selenocysteine-containing dehydrogenase